MSERRRRIPAFVSSSSRPSSEIPEEAFARLYFHVDSTANRLVAANQLPHHPSFFETLTALAFLYFAEVKIDIAVLEVGLGGRLDATNIVEPLLSVITDIALDHQDYLGSTIAEIAREKAGILRPNGTLITLPQHPEANQSIGEAAIALNTRAISAAPYLPIGCPMINASRAAFHRRLLSTAPTPSPHSPPTTTTSTSTPNPSTSAPPSPASTSAATSPSPSPPPSNYAPPRMLVILSHRRTGSPTSSLVGGRKSPSSSTATSNETGYNIPNAAIELGIANTSWPGRLEFIPPNLLLDVAHNPAGAWTLRAAIATLPESQPRTLIFSCLRDKDLTEISRILFPLFDAPHQLILTPIDNPRAASLDSLLAAAAALSIPARAAHSPAEALVLARSLTPPGGLILATGSIFLVGALRTPPSPRPATSSRPLPLHPTRPPEPTLDRPAERRTVTHIPALETPPPQYPALAFPKPTTPPNNHEPEPRTSHLPTPFHLRLFTYLSPSRSWRSPPPSSAASRSSAACGTDPAASSISSPATGRARCSFSPSRPSRSSAPKS